MIGLRNLVRYGTVPLPVTINHHSKLSKLSLMGIDPVTRSPNFNSFTVIFLNFSSTISTIDVQSFIELMIFGNNRVLVKNIPFFNLFTLSKGPNST